VIAKVKTSLCRDNTNFYIYSITDEIIDYLIDNHKEAYIDDCLCERDNAHNMTFFEWAEWLVDLEGSDYILNEYNKV
jgi:hypothetical protein